MFALKTLTFLPLALATPKFCKDGVSWNGMLAPCCGQLNQPPCGGNGCDNKFALEGGLCVEEKPTKFVGEQCTPNVDYCGPTNTGTKYAGLPTYCTTTPAWPTKSVCSDCAQYDANGNCVFEQATNYQGIAFESGGYRILGLVECRQKCVETAECDFIEWASTADEWPFHASACFLKKNKEQWNNQKLPTQIYVYSFVRAYCQAGDDCPNGEICNFDTGRCYAHGLASAFNTSDLNTTQPSQNNTTEQSSNNGNLLSANRQSSRRKATRGASRERTHRSARRHSSRRHSSRRHSSRQRSSRRSSHSRHARRNAMRTRSERH